MSNPGQDASRSQAESMEAFSGVLISGASKERYVELRQTDNGSSDQVLMARILAAEDPAAAAAFLKAYPQIFGIK